MWIKYKVVANLIAAEMCYYTLEAEGLPTKILPVGDILSLSEKSSFNVYVPTGREHGADEILRKL